MCRKGLSRQVLGVWLAFAAGPGFLVAGVFDSFPAKPKSKSSTAVARGQEPIPAPGAVAGDAIDPGYVPPPPVLETAPYPPSPPSSESPFSPNSEQTPQFSGFSPGYTTGFSPEEACQPRRGAGDWHFQISYWFSKCCQHKHEYCARVHRRLCPTSSCMCCRRYTTYTTPYPLCSPTYGHNDPCWRGLPVDCRCPVNMPLYRATLKTDSTPRNQAPTLEQPQADPKIDPPPSPQSMLFR